MSAHTYCPGHPGGDVPRPVRGPLAAECPVCTPPRLLGQLDATVQLLTTEQARAELPELFAQDEADPYFNIQGAYGNAQWVDYWPDWVVVVRSPRGGVVMVSNASRWHLEELGYVVPAHEQEGL